MPHSGSAFAEMLAHTAEHDAAGISAVNSGSGANTQPSNAAHATNIPAYSTQAAVENFYTTKKRSDVYVGGAVFPGCYGPLHSVNNKEFAIDSNLGHQLQELTFNEVRML